jgi:U3 small nucleolar RNA-associated protein 22
MEVIFSVLFVQVWARQRDSIHSHDGLNGYLIAIILSYLVAYEKVNSSMRPLQIFRVTLDFIGMFGFSFCQKYLHISCK